MKTKLLTLLAFFISISCFSQSANFNLVKQFGGGIHTDTRAKSTTLDAAGNIYIAGTFVGTGDFDPGPGVFNLTSAGSSNSIDAYILKLDSSGNFLWVKQIENEHVCEALTITLDDAGNIYIGGVFSGSTDFDPGAGTYILETSPSQTANAVNDAFLLKLDNNGNFIWAKQFGGNISNNAVNDVAVDHAGNVYAGGIFQAASDFDPGPGILEFMTGAIDGYLLKLNPQGNLVWAKQISSLPSLNFYNFLMSMTIDNAGNVYGTGRPADMFLDSSMLGAYVVKLDTDGNLSWVKQFTGSCQPRSITVDATGNVLTAGDFYTPSDFDPGPNSYILQSPLTPNVIHCFISKLDNNGNFIWAKPLYGDYGITGYTVKADLAGNVYTAGSFLSTVDFDPGTGYYPLTATGLASNIFVTKLSSSGNFVWAKKAGSCAYAEAFGMAIDSKPNVFITGLALSGGHFDNTILSDAGSTQFIAKLTQSSSTVNTLCLGNRVWNDINKNGIDNNEPGVPGLTVNLYKDDNNDNVPDDCLAAVTVTNATGNYSFCNLDAGNYIVGVEVPVQYYPVSVNGVDPDNNIDKDNNSTVIIPKNGSTTIEVRGFAITLTPGAEPGGSSINNTYDFGLVKGPLCLGNRIWNDINKNGKLNSNEPGLAGFGIELYKVAHSNDPISAGVFKGVTSTDANGYYSFCGLFPGYYIVYVAYANGYQLSKKNGGDPDNNKDNDNNGVFSNPAGLSAWGLPITLTENGEPNGNTNNTYDFGFHLISCDDDEDDDRIAYSKGLPVSDMQAETATNKINTVYPNPFIDEVKIELESSEAVNAIIAIKTMDGKTVITAGQNLVNGKNLFTINGLQKLSGGIYILEIRTGKNIFIKKIVKH